MEWYIGVLRQYAVYTGRARRKEYWMFFLFSAIVTVILNVFDLLFSSFGLASLVYSLAVFLPATCVSIRRLHDTGRSGWWLLLCFIPILGFLVLVFFLALEGVNGENEYGLDPKYETT